MCILSYVYMSTILRKTASLSIHWQTKGNPPESLRDLLPDNLPCSSALVHRTDIGTISELLQRVPAIANDLENFTRMTLTMVSPTDNLQLETGNKATKRKKKIVKDAFNFLLTVDFSMALGAECKDYIVAYSGEGFMPFSGSRNGNILDKLKDHPMFEDVKELSNIALATFGCSGNFEAVTSKGNAIYVTLLYLHETPAYYIGKADGGIKARWCYGNGHCAKVDAIIRFLESAPGAIEAVIHGSHQASDLAVAGAVMKQMATGSAGGVAVFAIDFYHLEPDQQKGKTNVAGPIYEQHYINAFEDLFPGIEEKMQCLNVQSPAKAHKCGDESPCQCGAEVALSLFLHHLTGPMY